MTSVTFGKRLCVQAVLASALLLQAGIAQAIEFEFVAVSQLKEGAKLVTESTLIAGATEIGRAALEIPGQRVFELNPPGAVFSFVQAASPVQHFMALSTLGNPRTTQIFIPQVNAYYPIPPLPGGASVLFPKAINDNATLIGTGIDSSTRTQMAAYWTPGMSAPARIADARQPRLVFDDAHALQTVGGREVALVSGDEHLPGFPYLQDAIAIFDIASGTAQTLPPLPGVPNLGAAEAFGLNAQGTIIGALNTRGVVWTSQANGSYQADYLPSVSGYTARPFAINNQGLIVGQFQSPTSSLAAVWESGNAYALSSIARNTPQGCTLSIVLAVNGHGDLLVRANCPTTPFLRGETLLYRRVS